MGKVVKSVGSAIGNVAKKAVDVVKKPATLIGGAIGGVPGAVAGAALGGSLLGGGGIGGDTKDVVTGTTALTPLGQTQFQFGQTQLLDIHRTLEGE